MTGGTTAGSADVDRIDDVAGEGEDPDDDQECEHRVGQGQHPGVVDLVLAAADRAEALVGPDSHVSSVERGQR